MSAEKQHMNINALVLSLTCSIALVRPLWGLAILLISECTLFGLGSYATVQLPIGYAGISDVFVICLLIGAYSHARKKGRSSLQNHKMETCVTLRSAILPYLIWFAACCLIGIIWGTGGYPITLLIRHTIAAVLPWSLVVFVWFMRDQVKKMIKMAIIVASGTALVHIAIQLFDMRSWMYAAYWASASGIDEYQEYLINEGDFVRGLPRGIILMLYCQIFCFSAYLTSKDSLRKNPVFLLLSLLQVIAIGITFTRSLMAEAIAGCGLAVVLASKVGDMRKLVQKKMFGAFFVGVFCLVIIMAAKPQIFDYWGERVQNLQDDLWIFSTETVRGIDNVASLKAISDKPLFGWGMFVYPDAYSFRETHPTDIHPLLEIGLVGGIPCIMLFVYLQWTVASRFFINSRNDMNLRGLMLPYFTVIITTLLVINTIGAGGTISGPGLIAMALFIGFMAAEFENAKSVP
ncbi:MAG: hypothetical protein Q7T18_12515 [Sedimentisphaerales bacterium]|nr:hypothetical protein [Sedimentisphaerales bacterium]